MDIRIITKRLDIEGEKFYQICTNHRYEKILYKDIYYVYKDEKYAIFVTQNGNIPIRETLKNIYKDLEFKKEFIFIDRGYIVNVVHIMSLYKNTIYLRNSKNLKISRTYTEEVKREFTLIGRNTQQMEEIYILNVLPIFT
ncbi:MAG: LytR/AlgR family response regulator transcription factor [Ruminococcus sp.]